MPCVFRGARLAALLLAVLAALAAGCKPSSLAPFTSMKGPDTGDAIDGPWAGFTNQAGTISFQVASGQLADLRFFSGGPCGWGIEGFATKTYPIVNNAVSIDIRFTTQGRLLIEATFDSNDAMHGTWAITGMPATDRAGCPADLAGDFVATHSR